MHCLRSMRPRAVLGLIHLTPSHTLKHWASSCAHRVMWSHDGLSGLIQHAARSLWRQAWGGDEAAETAWLEVKGAPSEFDTNTLRPNFKTSLLVFAGNFTLVFFLNFFDQVGFCYISCCKLLPSPALDFGLLMTSTRIVLSAQLLQTANLFFCFFLCLRLPESSFSFVLLLRLSSSGPHTYFSCLLFTKTNTKRFWAFS